MGEHEGWVEPVGLSPNGFLPGANSVIRALDADRWLRAEERTNELIACIQPNRFSEERRNAVADYVKQLIMKCFPCQVCTFGSVPLKTYLPDGDIDLTVFSHDQNLKETWANQVRDMLENEEKNENAEYHVKEVQYIQADVKIIKCLVENIVVDISYNQVGGFCTLCFLVEVDHLISQNHLFKRSIILIKAWCYYESRILGAHHGLISTYALETLVLYIFHVFNNSFRGPLEVLYRFLEFFSNFDWDHFCVSLWGPVPISSLPNMTAEPPRKDSGDLLLSKLFLDACSSAYAVFPGGQETNGQNFVSKHFNVIDPLRVINNLGRSVSRGNFYRIRSAFAFGAKRLARLLDCSNDNLIVEVNQFFMNTWERHGSGRRPDAAEVSLGHISLPAPDAFPHSRNFNNDSVSKNINENCSINGIEESGIQGHVVPSQYGAISARMIPKAELVAASHMQNLKTQNPKSLWRTDKVSRESASDDVLQNDGAEKGTNVNHLVNESSGRFLFARTRSSPDLTDAIADVSTLVRSNRYAESNGPSPRTDASNRRKNLGSAGLSNHIRNLTANDTSSAGNAPLLKEVDGRSVESDISSNRYHRDVGLDLFNEDISPTSRSQINQEEQDIVNMMSSASLQGLNGQLHAPFGLSSMQVPFSISPNFIASMGYNQRNLPGLVPANIPLMDPSFSNVQYTHGFVSPHLTHYFAGAGVSTPSEASFEQHNENFSSTEMKRVDVDDDFWQEQAVLPSSGYESENGNFDMIVSDHKPHAPALSLKYIPPHLKDANRGIRYNMSNADGRNNEVYAEERSQSSRFSTATHSNSLRIRTSSDGSRAGSSLRTPKSTKEKWPRKVPSADQAPDLGRGKIMSDHMTDHAESDELEWVSSSDLGETIEIITRTESVNSLKVPGHDVSGPDIAQTSGGDSMLPLAPILIGPGSRQKVNDNSGLVAFYPTGPPIPFLTMLPVYNIPETRNSDSSCGPLVGDENSEADGSMQMFNSERSSQSEVMSPSCSLRGRTSSETSETKKSDILNSDFASHWQNLQFGRFCQNPQYQGPLLYPSPVMVPPGYLPGRLPYETPGRPLSTNMSLMSQLMASYGHRVVPVAPLQPISTRPPNVYQPYIDEMPRFRSGTGTYLPNPKIVVRERQPAGSRRGHYRDDRNDSYGDRDGNWNSSSRSRTSIRSHNRGQTDKSNLRSDRLSTESGADSTWNSYRQEPVHPHPSQNGPLSLNSRPNGPQNMTYSTYPFAAMNPNSLPNGPVPPVVMLYPFDNNAAAYGGEHLEFGSLGPIGFPGMSEQMQTNEGSQVRLLEERRLHGSSVHKSSPDQPSSPHYQR